MREIRKNTQAEADELASRVHEHLISSDQEYARSVAEGHTVRWDTPRQLGAEYVVLVDERSAGCLTDVERAAAFPPDDVG